MVYPSDVKERALDTEVTHLNVDEKKINDKEEEIILTNMAKPVLSSCSVRGYDFYQSVLKSPKYIVAPMVDGSELAWRILSRQHGAQVCYSPMLHAKLFSESSKYRADFFSTNVADRPLIVQFCANDPSVLLRAARLVENVCDAVDINFGCPQDIARRGHYGSYLQDDWSLIHSLISTLSTGLTIPVTAKIRVFSDPGKTVKYAKMIENAGASLLTVHGRLRDQKGHHTGLADWSQIRAVKKAVNIPVFANGNILYHDDIERCLQETGADGVMTAEGHLYNPCIFEKDGSLIHVLVDEYLDICTKTNTCPGIMKGHLFKLYKPSLSHYTDLRDQLSKVTSLQGFRELSTLFKERLQDDEQNCRFSDICPLVDGAYKSFPHWMLQPFIRPTPLLLPSQKEKRKSDGEKDLSNIQGPISLKRTRDIDEIVSALD